MAETSFAFLVRGWSRLDSRFMSEALQVLSGFHGVSSILNGYLTGDFVYSGFILGLKEASSLLNHNPRSFTLIK